MYFVKLWVYLIPSSGQSNYTVVILDITYYDTNMKYFLSYSFISIHDTLEAVIQTTPPLPLSCLALIERC